MFKKILKILRLGDHPSILIYFLAGSLDSGFLNFQKILVILFGLFCLSISAFVINEYIDSFDTDKFSLRDPKNGDVKSIFSRRGILLLWLIFASLGCGVLLFYQLFWQAALIIIPITLYSLPPLRFKARFLLDIAALVLSFMIAPYSIGFALQNKPIVEMFQFPFFAFTLALAPAEAIHFLVDIGADEKAGLRSTAVVLGRKNLIRLSKIFLISGALVLSILIYQHSHWWYYPLILALPYVGYAVGRLREVVYDPSGHEKTFHTAYHRGIRIGNVLVICFLAALYFLSL